MLTTLKGVRRLLQEELEIDPEDPSSWPPGWVTDVLVNVMNDIRNDPDVARRELELIDTLHAMGVSRPIAYLVSQLMIEAEEYPEDWQHCAKTFRLANQSKQCALSLIVAGKQGAYEMRNFYVMIDDIEGHISHTLGADPSDVWCFNPETLELLHVPTFQEVLMSDDAMYARRSDIEGGKIG